MIIVTKATIIVASVNFPRIKHFMPGGSDFKERNSRILTNLEPPNFFLESEIVYCLMPVSSQQGYRDRTSTIQHTPL